MNYKEVLQNKRFKRPLKTFQVATSNEKLI